MLVRLFLFGEREAHGMRDEIFYIFLQRSTFCQHFFRLITPPPL